MHRLPAPVPTRPRPAGRTRLVSALVLTASIAVAVSGCTGGSSSPDASPTPSATRSDASGGSGSDGSGAGTGSGTGSGSGSGTASATPSATPTPSGTPVALSCAQLLTAQQLYDFNPNFGVDPGYAPKAGTLPAEVGAANGRTCSVMNQTSGEVVEYAVARPASSAVDGLENAAIEDLKPVPTYGTPPAVEGYFGTSGDRGLVEVFTGPWWVVMSSNVLLEPGDAAPLVADVLGNLPAG